MNGDALDPHSIAITLLGTVPSSNEAARERDLTHLVIILLQEVEALRRFAIASSSQEYARAYESSSAVAHNSAGPTTGLEKLLSFYLDSSNTAFREGLLLQRLGYTSDELDRVSESLAQSRTLS